ncbi:hypothetical protein [Streptomyces sp. NPDC003832]
MKFLAAFTLVPILCFAFQDIGSKYGELEWLTVGYAALPMMAGPVLILLLFIRNRDLIRDPRKGSNFSRTVKIVACLFLLPNVFATIGYSLLAVISVLSSLAILVADRMLKRKQVTA